MWLIFGLLSSILWSAVSIFDRYTVKSVFTQPSQGLFIASIFSAIGLVGIVIVDFSRLTGFIVFMSLGGGVLLQLSQWCYFYAIDEEEAGDVAAMGSTYPLLVALLAVPLGRYLNTVQWAGIVLVVFAASSIRGLNAYPGGGWKGLKYIIGYVCLLALSNLVTSTALKDVEFWDTFPFFCAGLTVGGLIPFISAKERTELKVAWSSIYNRLWQFGSIELINIAALGCEVYALSLEHPALVTAAASTEPAFVFLAANYLCSHLLGPTASFPEVAYLRTKICLVLIMATGLGMLAIN